MTTKYHNVRTHGFDSKKEERRYRELKIMEAAGMIQDLKCQVPYMLIPSQYIGGKCVERAVTYKADFVYKMDGKLVVEDCKGFKTPDYIIKRKLMLHVYGIRVKET